MPVTRDEYRWLPPVLVLTTAAALFGLHLGSSSLFIDEVYSWRASRGNLADLTGAVRYSEVTPPLYYLILHAWLSVSGGDSEALLRAPSVLCGVALVGAVHWLGRLVAGRTAGLIAAALATISPIVLLYSQQVRAYVWVMLALTIAVAAAIQATRDRSWRWTATAALAAVCAVLLHYTSLLVLAPLVAWMCCQSELAGRWRLAFAAGVGLAVAAVAPLAIVQMAQGHHDSAETYASLTTFNALRLAGTPFDGRASGGLMLWREIGAVVVIDALALLALSDRFRRMRERWLIVMCGLVPLLVVATASALAQPVALTRYTAVAAPFILVAIGIVAAHAHRVLAIVLVAGAVVASGAALVASQGEHGQNPDTRAAVAMAAAGWSKGDVVAGIGLLGFDGALSYYGEKLLPPGTPPVSAFGTLDEAVAAPSVFSAAERRSRLWLLADPPLNPAQLRSALSRLSYEATATQVFDGNAPVQLVRAEPMAAP
ncbi:MAG TPA: glycosyltransferase family 39 protein [Solirubrobacteraceae bacterium]|nr:glycosyltransferase family 39 protein [Solirubrobacteraceae bacterium]